ncbi:MAG: ankyrin repeat domain-containing protein [Rhodospirillales bacterium]|nr:ankyrin repeat domain-containing protein [Rhodospirillales bacterium]
MRNRIAAGLVTFAVVAMTSSGAIAQFSESYNFLKAARERDGAKATELVSKPGSIIINTRDEKTGESALHIVTKGRDLGWMNFLLSRDAKTDQRDNQGNTPLMVAAQLGFIEGAQLLIKNKASVDLPNASGETPLIRAVQLRNGPMVQLLMTAGANPTKADTIAGMSARDYAQRDSRAASILKIITEAKVAKPTKSFGPN